MFIATIIVISLAGLPALLFLLNLAYYRPPRPLGRDGARSDLSILIPARDEEAIIASAVESALASAGVDIEVIVLDDDSSDATAAIVRGIAGRDPRVRLETAPPLQSGWCGKQHACWQLARLARRALLLFIDADVQLRPDGAARLVGFLKDSDADLVSGVPWQETGTFLERLLIPLIHFILLGFLSVRRMRLSRWPALAAGCGQLFLARRDAYMKAGGHAAIRTSLHDGITLPRAFRRAGLRTDLCDATPLAVCRMYRGAVQTWNGLAKNATEGLAGAGLLIPATLLLLGGHVLPWLVLPAAYVLGSPLWPWFLVAMALSYLPRLIAVWRFDQPLAGTLLHPVGVALLVAIQWHARLRQLGSMCRRRGKAELTPR